MDYSWLIIFIIISVVSSILSKRKEKQEEERRAREQAGQKPTVTPPAKPSPAAGPPPVAPGPFGPMWKPAPARPAEPPKPPPPVLEERKVEEDMLPEVPQRPLFQEMRRELEQRQAKEVEQPLPPPVFRPVEIATPRVAAASDSARERAIPAGVGESLANRLVAETPRKADAHAAPKRTLTRSTLRQAVIMSELINKPLAIRRQDDSWEAV